MKVSVCITVLNEEDNISELLKSLLIQTKKPNEIIIVDGGSTDKTIQIIKHFQKKDQRIKLIVEKGSIAHGRNTSIELAKNPVIATTDAGCVARKTWLGRITGPFEHKDIGIVAGFYKMKAKNSMQKAINFFLGVSPEQFDPISFMPSNRSVAFRKEVWEKIGCYSEKFKLAGEDTHFFYKAVKLGVKIMCVKEAIVEWGETSRYGFYDAVKKFYQYAKGDAQAGIWWHPNQKYASHNINIMIIFFRYLVGMLLVIYSFFNPSLIVLIIICLTSYFFWAFRKIYLNTKDVEAGLWGILIQIASDLAIMAGFISGLTVGK